MILSTAIEPKLISKIKPYPMFRSLLLILTIISLNSCEEKIELSDAYGNFEATISTISSESNGKLLFLNVEEGNKIKANNLIAIVDTTQLHLQRQQIKATIGTLPKKLRNDLAEIEVLEKQKLNLIRERDRVKGLLEKKAATPKQLDDMNGELVVIDKRIAAIQSQTKITNRGILAEKAPLLAQINVIDDQIKKSYIYNPVTGTVITKMTEPFEIVGMGTPLYRIGQLDTMTLKFYASATQLQKVKLGHKIEVLIDAGKEDYQTLEGSISWIAEQSEFTPKTIQTKEDRVNLVYAIKAKVPNPNGFIKIGMPAEVNFEIGKRARLIAEQEKKSKS